MTCVQLEVNVAPVLCGQSVITCHWLGEGGGGKLEHVEVVRLRYGKAVVDLPPPGPFAFATLIEAQSFLP